MNGILLVDKPADWTSHDVVAKLRGVLGERRMGHSGTLDPMATGLLVVFAGRATRAVSFSENHSKCYEARLRLGLTTDTQDTTGTVLSRCDRRVTRTELEAVLPQFRGDILQVPPMYSALKVDGKKLYEIARRGGEVAREARPITIGELTVLGEADGDYVLRVRCSKGTYIRSLCHDIHQCHLVPHKLVDGFAQQWEMGTAENQRVHTEVLDVGEIFLHNHLHHFVVRRKASVFYQRNEQRAGTGNGLNARTLCVQTRLI